MAIPSFDELLEKARQVGERESERIATERTSQLAAKGFSDLVNTLLFTPHGERKEFAGSVSREGEYTPFPQPRRTGLSLAEKFFGYQPMTTKEFPSGSVPVTREEYATKALPTLFKAKSSLESTLGSAHPSLSNEELENIYGIKGLTPTTTFNQLRAMRQPTKRPQLSIQKAMDSGFSTSRELKTLFPNFSETELSDIPVSEVMAKRAEKRAEVISGLRSATSDEVKDLANADVMKKQISDIKNLAESTGYKGIGLLSSFVNKAGQYSPIKELETDPDVVELYQQLNDVQNQMIYLRSGKQINEAEYDRLKTAFPTPSLNESAFKRRLETFSNIFDEVMRSREERLRGTGRRIGGTGDSKINSDPLGIR